MGAGCLAMLAVLGLGNPGDEYRGTRHNVGFRVLERLAGSLGERIERQRFRALVAEARLGEEKLLLACPQTFMNESGRSARAVVDFYGLEAKRLLVVCDDFHLEFGRLRVRAEGSSGGHNGLESVIRELGTEAFPRLRLGIGECRGDSVGYVLGRFSRADEEKIDPAIDRAASAVRVWAEEGMENCMNRFNAVPTDGPAGPAKSEGGT
jgi:peptidyl-tRNA hydrolase, PTH1 family